jgi:hypothetical protein
MHSAPNGAWCGERSDVGKMCSKCIVIHFRRTHGRVQQAAILCGADAIIRIHEVAEATETGEDPWIGIPAYSIGIAKSSLHA